CGGGFSAAAAERPSASTTAPSVAAAIPLPRSIWLPAEPLLQAVEPGLVDAADRSDRLLLAADRVEPAAPLHGAAVGAVLADAQLGAVVADGKRSAEDRV